mmetsp:Transcript_30973/g.49822  ORF Transcript_30973/g.49822 Transcript_30973/m.49822 type:complete len:244 (-) Transcript_30973:140-871(-)
MMYVLYDVISPFNNNNIHRYQADNTHHLSPPPFFFFTSLRKGDSADTDKFDPLVLKAMQTFNKTNQFKNIILQTLVSDVDDEEMKKLVNEFNKMDTDGSNKIGISELQKVLGGLHSSEVASIMDKMDVDGNQEIDLEEFGVMYLNRKISSQQQRLWAVFNKLDKNNNGKLCKTEILAAMEGKMSKKEVEKIIKSADKDGNLELDFSEFLVVWEADQLDKVMMNSNGHEEKEGAKTKKKKCSIM